MFASWRKLSNELRQVAAFRRLPEELREVVFYSEGQAYWPHLEAIVRALWLEHQQPITYLTSEKDDPVLKESREGLYPFYIGEHSIGANTLATISARLVVMTMPDLQTFHIKRSPEVTHYAYIHHSIVSSHMVYRPAAFDHFDSIFCVGPHHMRETRSREALLGLRPKELVEHGYGRLDALIEAQGFHQADSGSGNAPEHILVAPSWGPHALLERHGSACVTPLLDAGYAVTLRPHPQTRRIQPTCLDAIRAECAGHPRFELEEDVASQRSLLEASVMVSDWSGAALEFAFSRLRPVLFVDVPRKINNPDYEALEIEPLEVSIRQDLGAIIPELELRQMGERVPAMTGKVGNGAIVAARDESVFNLGHSGSVAAAALMGILRR
jgi:hypothetical protein